MDKLGKLSFIRSLPRPKFYKKKEPADDSDDMQYEMVPSDKELADEDSNIPAVYTIDDIIDEIGLRMFHVRLFLLLGCVNLLDSLEVAALSVIAPLLKSKWQFSIWDQAMLPLVLTLGMIIGASFWGWISDEYGRKTALVGSVTSVFCFGLTSSLALNYIWLLVLLFCVGFGIATPTQVITMVEEFFPKQHRTTFSAMTGIFWSLAFLISAIAATQLNVLGYRSILALVCIPTVIFLAAATLVDDLVPDSPRFCLALGDEQKALLILQKIASDKNKKISNCKLYKNVDTVSKRGDIVQLFRHGVWKITSCLWIVWFFSMLSYYFSVYSATEIASENSELAWNLEKRTDNSYTLLAWMSLPELFLILLAALACHYFNIKTLLILFSFAAVVLQTILLVIEFDHIVLLIFVTLVRSCMMCLTTLIFIYTSDIYPTTCRGIGTGIAYSIGRIGMIVGPFISQTVFQKAYYIGILVNAGSLVFVLIAVVFLPSRSRNQELE